MERNFIRGRETEYGGLAQYLKIIRGEIQGNRGRENVLERNVKRN